MKRKSISLNRRQSARRPARKSKLSLKQTSPPAKPRLRLFIDPASISTGWALFNERKFVASGTIDIDNELPVFKRLSALYRQYKQTATIKLDEVHIEQLPRNCHVYTHWSVGVIGSSLADICSDIRADIPIQSWQKFCEWKSKRTPLVSYQGRVKSEDELAAIGMGLYWVDQFAKEPDEKA